MNPERLKKQAIASYKHWRRNPLDWVRDRFPSVVLSKQQEEYFVELGKLIDAKLESHAGRPLTEEQQIYTRKIGISIMAGQGVGKDFIAAMTICFYLDCCPHCKVTATGVTGKHLRNILWAEISKIMRLSLTMEKDNPRSSTVLEDLLCWQTEKVFNKGARNPGAEWFAEAVTINQHSNEEEQAKTLYGRHEDYQLIVVDEAAGVPEPVFGPLEGTLTRKCCIALMIFNPIKANGYAYDSHHKNAEQWVTARWSAEDSELVSRDHIEKMLRYGRESNTYRVKVLGLPPIVGSGGLIPYDKIREAINKEFDIDETAPVMCGIDPALGGDRSVVAIRQGTQVSLVSKITNTRDDLLDFCVQHLSDNDASVAFIDNIGNGQDLYRDLIKMGYRARPADSRSRADKPEQFFNKRAEMYWQMRDSFVNGNISIPNDEELIDELGAVSVEIAGDNKVKIEDKKAIKRRLGSSPDKADALAMSFYKPDAMFRKGGRMNTSSINYAAVYIR